MVQPSNCLIFKSYKNEACTNCGRKLETDKSIWLELSLDDGNYYEKIPDNHQSQGGFPFGVLCAKKELTKTKKNLLRRFIELEVKNFYDITPYLGLPLSRFDVYRLNERIDWFKKEMLD